MSKKKKMNLTLDADDIGTHLSERHDAPDDLKRFGKKAMADVDPSDLGEGLAVGTDGIVRMDRDAERAREERKAKMAKKKGVDKYGDEKVAEDVDEYLKFLIEYKELYDEDLEKIKVLGKGASSVVSLARHKKAGVLIALKTISIADATKRDQLVKEVKILFQTQCDSLVSFYGAYYNAADRKINIGLEYMDRGSLEQVQKMTKNAPIPEKVLAAITLQVLWGLGYLQYEERVHRDLKPGNILMNSKGEIKLTDFGISKELEGSLMAGTYVGTFRYMSPERARGERYSYPSDIWSLGLILVELAAGRYPYKGASYIELVVEICDGASPNVGREFSKEFRDFTAKCLEKTPGDRLAADVLVGSEWLTLHEVTDLEAAMHIVQRWSDGIFKDKEADAKLAEKAKEKERAAAAEGKRSHK